MSSTVQDIPNSEFNGIRNTGFPEPLSHDRNTTLPYPTADTSPTASIEASDIPITRASSRLRFPHSRHHSHNKSNTTRGHLNPGHMHDDIPNADGTKAGKLDMQLTNDSSPDTDEGQDVKSSSEERTSGEVDVQERSPHQKKKGFLSKRVFHRD